MLDDTAGRRGVRQCKKPQAPLKAVACLAKSTSGAKSTLGANRLFYGDNLDVLRKHVKDDTVDLCYIDPPFNSKRTYHQLYNHELDSQDLAQEQAFVDSWTWDDSAREGYQEIVSNRTCGYTVQTIELIKGLRNVLGEGSLLAYLVSMTRRIVEIHRVLKPTGSFYLHCDPTSSHYLKLVLDGVFCGNAGDFVNEIVWKRTSAHSSSKRYGPVHDVILFYAKSDEMTWVGGHKDYALAYVQQRFKRGGERPWKDADLTGSGVRHGETGLMWRGFDVTAKGRHWAYPPSELTKMDAAGGIYWPKKKGGWPRQRVFLDQAEGISLQDVWTDIPPINSQAQERLGWPTQKPEALLERIIQSSSDVGDLVLDAYCGCGTSVAVAERLGRQWIGMDITYQAIAVILKRLEDTFPGQNVAHDVIMDGIPRDIESARALANKRDDRVRKEFEKWAVLTYSRNRAALNYKKGADGGIDGTAYFYTSPTETAKVVFQVKSGGVERGDVAKLKGDMDREKAAVSVLITLDEPTQPMRAEAKKAGLYTHAFSGASHDRVQIVTIRQIIEQDERFKMPLSAEVLKAAKPIVVIPEQPELPILRSVMAKAGLRPKRLRGKAS